MRIKSARITNYRSVVDSNTFDIEPEKTILVGINEAGKTALLKALQQLNAPTGTDPIDYLADYPRSQLNELQTGVVKEASVRVTTATFDLDSSDLELIPDSLKASDTPNITIIRYLNNTLRYQLHGFTKTPTFSSLRMDLTRLRAHVAKDADSADALASLDHVLAIDDLRAVEGADAEFLRHALDLALPHVDEDNEKETGRWQRLGVASKICNQLASTAGALLSRLPLFVYYSTYFTVRPRIDLESLAARQERGDIDGEYDFGNLCLLKLLGFSAKHLSELAAGAPIKPHDYADNPSAREAHDAALTVHHRKLDERHYSLNAASAKLTQDIQRIWGQEMTLRLIADGQYLKVMVEDDLGVEVELDQRSEGFRWLVSFFVVFRAQARDELAGAILLLDEPGMSLHALKQQEFRKTISLLGSDNQIIYTTHSPFMVGSDELDLVRIVEMPDRSIGTKIHTRLQVDDPRSVFPLQAALGYELAQTMFSQKRNLVCEGVTDMFYINALNAAAAADGGPILRNDPAIVPAGSASKIAYYCTIYVTQKLMVAALLDSDNAGDTAAKQESLVALLPKKSILRAGDFIDPSYPGAETEDMIRETLIGVASTLGWDSTSTATAQPTRPLIDILEKEHGKGKVSKWKLAKGFAAWLQSNGYNALTEDEKLSWTKFCTAVNKAL
ncbi:AAA family ATPase [Rhodococcus sp. GB-02]